MGNLPYMSDGSLYSSRGNEIVDLSILCVPEDDMLLKYGSYEDMIDALEVYSKSVKGVRLYKLDMGMVGVEDAYYILLRSILFTQTGFIRRMCEYVTTSNFLVWLDNEKDKIPLNFILERVKSNGR